MSQETICYPFFKPEIVSQAHKGPYNWNKKIFQKPEKFKIYPKTTKTGVIKNVEITIPLNLEIMQQLIVKPWRRSQGLC